MTKKLPSSNSGVTPRVRFACYRDEDTGRATPLYLYSHDAIDVEIDRCVRIDPSRAAQYEATRAKWHSQLGCCAEA